MRIIAIGQKQAAPKVVAVYLPYWSSTEASVAALPGSKFTHINYAFATVNQNATVSLTEPLMDAANFAGLATLKAANPHLRVLISLGGWSGSKWFSDIASTSGGRTSLANSTADLFLGTHGNVFDGVDIDWEYPVEGGDPLNTYRAADKQNFTLLLQEFRNKLDSLGKPRRPELTIAVTTGAWAIANLEVPAIANLVDWIYIMTYDYVAGSATTGLNAPLYRLDLGDPLSPCAETAVDQYIAAGAPAKKLLNGAPFYAQHFGSVANVNNGLGQTGTEGVSTDWPNGAITYAALIAANPASMGYTLYTHASAGSQWYYDSAAQIFITHESTASILSKSQFAKSRGLRGVFAWEITQDNATYDLTNALWNGML